MNIITNNPFFSLKAYFLAKNAKSADRAIPMTQKDWEDAGLIGQINDQDLTKSYPFIKKSGENYWIDLEMIDGVFNKISLAVKNLRFLLLAVIAFFVLLGLIIAVLINSAG